jgi:serine/threonine-protein kinase
LIQLAQGGVVLRFQVMPAIAPELPRSPKLPKLPKSSLPKFPPKLVCTHEGNAAKNLFCVHCGQPVNVKKTIRQYQILRVLGKGGMGTTYLMWNPAAVPSGQPAKQAKGMLQVLKEMNPDIVQIPKARELFEREAAILRSLDHPGIPRFYDFFSESGKKYLVMELLHGQDLEKRVQQKGIVPVRQAIGWMIQTCEVLDYLHDRATPIIHRDIKPGNLLVQTVTDRIVVLDFGAVKITEMYSGTRIGAEGFSAPEQIQGRPVPQSDLYAIGPTLVYLLTGESPQQFYKKRNGSYRFVLEGIPHLTPALQQVIERVTELRPSDRYATAKELAQALSRCL